MVPEIMLGARVRLHTRGVGPTHPLRSTPAVSQKRPRVLRIAIEMANIFRICILKMQKEWRIAPEKRRFFIYKWPYILPFEVNHVGRDALKLIKKSLYN